jgi:hypothetical protein
MAPFPWLELTFRQQQPQTGVPRTSKELQSPLMTGVIEENARDRAYFKSKIEVMNLRNLKF